MRYAKEDIYRELDEGIPEVKIRRLIARKGQPIPPLYESLVSDSETTAEAPAAPVVDETASTVPGITTFGHAAGSHQPESAGEADPEQEIAGAEAADGGQPELKGGALDEALEEAGLPKTGSADEKRARLADHRAAQA